MVSSDHGRMHHLLRPILTGLALAVTAAFAAFGGEPVTLQTRARVADAATGGEQVVEKSVSWDPARTAVVVCDMWDRHHCPDATERVAEMAPRMNEVLKAARAKGMLIIHCPSDTMDFYQDHPGRKLAQAAPQVETEIPLRTWCHRDEVKEPALPIDDSDGGCDGCPACPGHRAWTRQHPDLEIMEGDAVTDSAEAYYLMRQRGISNVIVMGVHINMCVLGRPFAIRQMAAQGQHVVLMRDLTDSMYNHRRAPYVNHFRGTELVVEHIERHLCPTITSVDFVGGEPFQFFDDVKKRIVFVIGENEYATWETLPEFARQELEWRGYEVSYVLSSPQDGDPEFQNIEEIKKAHLVVVSVRRRTPRREMIDLLRAHVAAGRPVIGIRTASHAFDAPPATVEFAAWPTFDVDVFGGHYEGHYNNKPPGAPRTLIEQNPAQARHPLLTGVPAGPFTVTSHLYKIRNLAPTTIPLLHGRVEGTDAVEPVAWASVVHGRHAFCTSLGSADDFKLPAFRRLLLNATLWCLRDPLPPAPADQ